MLSPDSPALLRIRARIEAIFFDLDGTLIDTDDAFLDSWSARLSRLSWLFPGGDPRPFLRHAVLAAEGPVNAFLTLLDALGLDEGLFAIGDRLSRVRGLRRRGQYVPVDGALDALRALRRAYRLGIVTTRSRADARAFLRQFELETLLEVVATREDTRRLKPHPQPIQRAISLVGLSPSQCAMVGDTAVDIISAKAAGVYAVGVLCGFGERDELLKAGADLILEDTSQLTSWF